MKRICPPMLKFCLLVLSTFIFQYSFAQNDCPSFPRSGNFDTITYIKTEVPTDDINGKVNGNIYIGQGYVQTFVRNYISPAFIPNNHPTWALAIAHAWNLERNLIKKVNYPQIGFWLATCIQETELGCVPDATWDQPSQTSPNQANATGNMGNGGCLQIEGPYSGYGAMSEAYPNNRFPTNSYKTLVQSPTGFETSCLVKTYFDMNTAFIYNYYMGWSVFKTIDCSVEKYAYIQTSASCYNAGPNTFLSAQSFFSPSQYSVSRWTGLPAAHSGYPEDVASWTSVLENDKTYAGYPAGSTFDSYYNKDITWTIVTDYLNIIAYLFPDVNFATSLTPKVKAAFDKIAVGGKVPFMKMGPVIDQIILNLPAEYPIPIEGSPIGVNLKCSGKVLPQGHIEITNGGTNLCLGESVSLKMIVDGGGGANPTFSWYKGTSTSGTPISTTSEVTITPTSVGIQTYTGQICNGSLCYQINTNGNNSCTSTANTPGFTVTTKKCSNCSMVATVTPTNTPCKGMNKGSIAVNIVNPATNWKISYSATTPLGSASGSITGSGTTANLTNLRDGSYTITVEDISDPNCNAKTSTIIGYTTNIDEYVNAKISSKASCKANLQADIVQLPAPCQWTAKIYSISDFPWPGPKDTVPSTSWENSINAVVKPGSGGTQFIKPNGTIKYYYDQNTTYNADEAVSVFSLNSGELITCGVQSTKSQQLNNYWFHIYDPNGKLVKKIFIPKNSIKTPQIYYGTPYTVTCPYTPPAYTFTWNPVINAQTDTPNGAAIKSTGNVAVSPTNDILYTVTATNKSNPQCILTDTVTVGKDSKCTPTCTPPTNTVSITTTSPYNICGTSGTLNGTISGTLTGLYYQWFNGTTAIGSPAAAVASPSLTVTTSGSYTLRIASSSSDINTSPCYKASSSVTVNITPTIATPKITALKNPLCVGEKLNLTASSTTSGVSFLWTKPNTATGIVILNDTLSKNSIANSETGNYAVYAILNGCTSTVSSNTNITVNSGPNKPTITATKNPLCEGENLTVTANSSTPGVTYAWIKPLPSTATSTNNTMNKTGVSTTEGGNYAAYAVLNGCSSSVSSSMNIVINSAPARPSLTALKNPLCVGEKLKLTVSPSSGVSFAWVKPTGTVNVLTANDTLSKNSVDVTEAGDYQVYAIANSCSSAVSLAVNITVTNSPSPTITSASTSYCADNTSGVTLSTLAISGATYEWFNGAVSQGAASTNNSYTGAKKGNWTVKIISNSCAGTSTSYPITENPSPTISITSSDADNKICAGDQIILSGKGASSYVWDNGVIDDKPFAPSGSGAITYKVTGSDANNCKGTASVTITVNSLPTAKILTSGAGLSYCSNLKGIRLAADSTVSGLSYQWVKNLTPFNASTKASFYPASVGSWTVKVSNPSTTCSATSTAVQVDSLAQAKAGISNTASSLQYCASQSGVNLTANAVSGATYDWYKGNVKQSGSSATYSSATGTSSGTDWFVIVTPANGCKDTSNHVTVTQTANASSSIVSTNLTYCQGASGVNLVAQYAGAGSTYQWYLNGNKIGSANSDTTYNNATAGDWTVETSVAGCSGVSSVKKVSAVALPVANISTPTSGLSYCKGSSISLSADDAGSGASYLWYSNGNLIKTTAINSVDQVTIQPGNSWTLRVVVGTCSSAVSSAKTVIENSIPSATISGNLSYCSNQSGTNLTAPALSNADYYWFKDGSPLAPSKNNVTSATAGKWKVKVQSPEGCVNYDSVTVALATASSASISGSATICSDGSNPASFSVVLNGPSPWDLVYKLPDGTTKSVSVAASPYTITGTQAGTYSLQSVSNASCGAGTVSGSATASYLSVPDTSNFAVICPTPGVNKYQISFNLAGGDAASYAITGATGSKAGSVWTSDLIDETIKTSLTISDKNLCQPLLIPNLQKVCSCPAEATISGSASICPGASTTVSIDFKGTAPWTFSYSDGSNIINGTSPTSPFTFSANAAKKYTLVSVSDQSACSGSVFGQADVQLFTTPTASFSSNKSICVGSEKDTVLVNLSGQGPWDFSYSNGSTTFPITNVSSNTYSLILSQVGSYSLVSAKDKNCTAASGDLSGSVVLTAYQKPDTSNLVLNCNNSDKFTISFNLSGGNSSSYSVLAKAGAKSLTGKFSGNSWVSDPIASNTSVNLTISDSKNCNPLVIPNLTKTCICPASAAVSAGDTICEGQSAALNLTFSGTAPFTYFYNLNNVIDSALVSGSSSTINISSSTDFTLLAIKDKNCVGTVDNTKKSAAVLVNSLPSVILSGGGQVCEGMAVNPLNFAFSGGLTPYSLHYTMNGTDTSITNISVASLSVNPSKTGLYVPTKLVDASGCEASSSLLKGKASVVVIPSPSATISGGGSICEGDTAEFVIQLVGDAPFSFSYSNGVQTESVFGIQNNTYALDIIVSNNGNIGLLEVNDLNCSNDKLSGQSASLSVTPLPVMADPVMTAGDTICNNSKTEISLLTLTSEPATFEWKTPISKYVTGGAPGIGDKISQTLTNTSTKKGYAQYEITPYVVLKSGKACYGASKNALIYVRKPTVPNLGENLTNLCVNSKVTLSVENFGSGTYQWFKNSDPNPLPNTTHMLIDTVERGTSNYTLIYTDVCDTTFTSLVSVASRPAVELSLSAVSDSCVEVPIVLTPYCSDPTTLFVWKINTDSLTSERNLPNLSYQFSSPGIESIKLYAYNKDCYLGDTTLTIKLKDCGITSFNTFTPNNDGANDTWYVDGLFNFPNASVQIFDRWGNLIRNFNGGFSNWDGNNDSGAPVENGVYYYLIDLKRIKGKKGHINGYITLLRDVK